VVELLLRRRHARETGPVIRLRRDDHVLFADGKARGSSRLEYDWKAIREAAGVADLHFHDLRHSFASFLVGQGLSLPVIGQLLGHSKPAMTARYAHVHLDPQRAAVAAIGQLVGKQT
jgi:integrase